MADDLRHQQLERLKTKASLLTDRYRSALQEKNDAIAKIAELEELIESQKKRLEKLEQELEYQKIATTIGQNRDDIERSRTILTELVREIDECINELTN